MNEMVVEKLASTIVTEGMTDEWLECVNILNSIIDYVYSDGDSEDPKYVSDILEDLETINQFLEEFKLESDRELVPKVYARDIEPRACGSCHMLGAWYGDDDRMKGWKCVLKNGPHFEFSEDETRNLRASKMREIWFKICDYYIRRVD